ncbi:MAG: hypothetical protein M0Z61_18350 [Nitrospiraceae bacterium]|nr:hypothetical protein [Nitrospiraceae bacterium]
MVKKLIAVILFLLVPLSFAVAAEQAYPLPNPKDIKARPPFSKGLFPCSQCHQGMPANWKRRKLTMMHQDIVLNHMPGGWCFDCHNPDNRDKLKLFTGESVSFDQSYLVCGQCHGFIFKEWKAGLHGKRTGMWNGEKKYYQCINCHWPHDPKFKSIKPFPAPLRPSDIK